VHTAEATVLLDCGLFQGRRRESRHKNESLGFDPSTVDAVVLSHAHIDHCGALPMLRKGGFNGSIHATAATRDLCAVMLEDAAMIQAADARHVNQSIARGQLDSDPVEVLFDETDVVRTLEQMVSLGYRRRHAIAPGVGLTFYEAGHVLGSAIVALDIDDEGLKRRLVFTGDLGRRHLPLLRDPEVPQGAEILLMESTYGDRFHSSIEQTDEELTAVVNRTAQRGGKIVIPSFALERAQEIVFSLKKLRSSKRIPPLPVYVDSPLTVNITQVFRSHPECLDEEARKVIHDGESPFEFAGLQYISEVADSIAIDRTEEPCIIISASGMCEAGRILHHLRATVSDAKNSVVIVGFQAPHTLGRKLVERRRQVRIFGVERELNAEVVVLDGFSAHADQGDLVSFAEAVRSQGPLRHVALVHGEPAAQKVLTERLHGLGFPSVHSPAMGEKLTV